MDIAFSPCPNDTFAIAAWTSGLISSSITPIPHFFDIQELNCHALKGTFPITKMSAFCFAKTKHLYELLPAGAAIGMDVGPKLIAKTKFDDVETRLIAHPGTDTTAYALLRILLPQAKNLVSMSYEKIVQAVTDGRVDAGVIIHESRFLLDQHMVVELLDLGKEYVRIYKAPIPLGVVCAKKTLPPSTVHDVVSSMQLSIDFAHAHRSRIMPFVVRHAQEMDSSVVNKHIDLYVTAETRTLTHAGLSSINQFLELLYEHKNTFGICNGK